MAHGRAGRRQGRSGRGETALDQDRRARGDRRRGDARRRTTSGSRSTRRRARTSSPRAAARSLLDGFIGTYQSGNSMLRAARPGARRDGQAARSATRSASACASGATARSPRSRPTHVQEIVFDNKNGHFEFARERRGVEAGARQGREGDRAARHAEGARAWSARPRALNAIDFAEPASPPSRPGSARALRPR